MGPRGKNKQVGYIVSDGPSGKKTSRGTILTQMDTQGKHKQVGYIVSDGPWGENKQVRYIDSDGPSG
jgi:hypothetical protein